MNLLGAISFATPLALAGLVALPVIWWLLRFTPPRPVVVRFPPIRLLMDLANREEQPDKTPWWLLLLRLMLAALVILGVSQPVYAPGPVAPASRTPILLIADDGWAAAGRWGERQAVMTQILNAAALAGAPVTLATTVPALRPAELAAAAAADVKTRSAALVPKALNTDRMALLDRLQQAFAANAPLHVIWLSDGLDDGQAAAFAAGLRGLGQASAEVDVLLPETADLPLALAPPGLSGGAITVTVLRTDLPDAQTVEVAARAGNGRSLAEASLQFAPGATSATTSIELPVELRNAVSRIVINGQTHAAATYLMDDRWRRKTVGLMAGTTAETAQPLLAPLYYVSRALEPYADLAQPDDTEALKSLLDQGLSMLVLADIGVLPAAQQELVASWVDKGGVLLRFAGPRLASAQDALIPVRLREGGRALGSALSWETPQPLQSFANASPFAGLTPDQAVSVSRQVLAEPDGDLPGKVWASLEDGTPLVTAMRQGKGLVVLFHVTANADWSNLPVSGLFVEMLRRVLDLAPAAGGKVDAETRTAEAQAFSPYRSLSGLGELIPPDPEIQPISAASIDSARASPATPAGLYRKGQQDRALNIAQGGDGLKAIGALPDGISVASLTPRPALALAPFAFALAMLLFLADSLAMLLMGGGPRRLRSLLRRGATPVACALIILASAAPQPGQADSADQFAMQNALETRLAYVITGDAETDQISEQGLTGLTDVLRERTSVEAGAPVGLHIERDELVFFPLLYWPVRPDATVPSEAALARIDSYMKGGGTILFDLREDGAGTDALSGGTTAAAEALRRILARLDIPALEPVPPTHVLTRSFYLLDWFPGRYDGGKLWVEAADSSGTLTNNADGVSGIIIGSNDYAAAWASDETGEPLYAVIPGSDRQREFAIRTGVNIVMYALTGNYKADQVHVPALLERLGQ